MKVSYHWLKEWADFELEPQALADALTMAGLEVDELSPVAEPLDGVVVGRITTVEPHPDADKLRVCTVDAGSGEPLTIVCGAPNAREGLRVPLATLGTTLPGGMKIKAARLRGVASSGMLCSEPELGLGDEASGLMELPADAPVGKPLAAYLGLDDHILDIDMTPNRADCLSVQGLARDIGAIAGVSVAGPAMAPVADQSDRTFPVRLDSPPDCPRYAGRVIEGVNLEAATPLWMVERLRRSGLRSLHPVVDVTNYVLLELGQPLHAFDLDKLSGGIVVRRAADGERLTLLDDREVELDMGMLVIADDSGPVALAGIMGGLNSAVDTTSNDIFLESAWFDPAAIVGRSRKFGLATESAHRFERGVDPELQTRALERATALIVEIAGGRPGPIIDIRESDHLPVTRPVRLRLDRLNRLLGTDLDDETVRGILDRLGMTVEMQEVAGSGPVYSVLAPSARRDIAIEADLIEEVARIHGYDRLPERRPGGSLAIRATGERQWPETALRNSLVADGFVEVMTWSFVSPEQLARLGRASQAQELANPLSRDQSVLRTTLLAGMLETAGANLRRQQSRLRLFELGTCFEKQGSGLAETMNLGLVLAGRARRESWNNPQREVDYFDLKGQVEKLTARSGGAQWRFEAPAEQGEEAPAWLHPGQAARIIRADETVGWMGQVHPGVVRQLDLPGRLFAAELALSPLLARDLPRYEAFSRVPGVRRDLALLIPDEVSASDLVETVRASSGTELRDVILFDLYRGEGVEQGYKSLAIGLIFQSLSSTLKDAEVDALVNRAVEALQARWTKIRQRG